MQDHALAYRTIMSHIGEEFLGSMLKQLGLTRKDLDE